MYHYTLYIVICSHKLSKGVSYDYRPVSLCWHKCLLFATFVFFIEIISCVAHSVINQPGIPTSCAPIARCDLCHSVSPCDLNTSGSWENDTQRARRKPHRDTSRTTEIADHVNHVFTQSSLLEQCLSSQPSLPQCSRQPCLHPWSSFCHPRRHAHHIWILFEFNGYNPFFHLLWLRHLLLRLQHPSLHCSHTGASGHRGTLCYSGASYASEVSTIDQYTAGSRACASGTSCASYQYVSVATNYDYLTSVLGYRHRSCRHTDSSTSPAGLSFQSTTLELTWGLTKFRTGWRTGWLLLLSPLARILIKKDTIWSSPTSMRLMTISPSCLSVWHLRHLVVDVSMCNGLLMLLYVAGDGVASHTT